MLTVGDVVYSKRIGCKVTIRKVYKLFGVAVCNWFDSTNQLHQKLLRLNDLQK